LCVLILVSQMLLASCERQRERKKGRQSIGHSGKRQPEPNQENEKGWQPKGGKPPPAGKFKTQENAECVWAVTNTSGSTVRVECGLRDSAFWCEFAGDPSSCAQYAANQRSFWKQVSRSLKKQQQICRDPRGVLKSKVCRRGPPSAHLKLARSSLLPAVGPAEGVLQAPAAASAAEDGPERHPQDCVEDIDYIDQRKVAQEYCPEGFISFCNFFITMVQDKKC
ncbi:FGFP1 protein, partial [Rhinopomastus cyanomelas]|nr:FGFP1 protein [Rhinopomastus cyanomelas]